MTTNLGPIVQRAMLSGELLRLRRLAGKTQEEVARQFDWSTSKILRIEGGAVSVSTPDLQALLRLYDVTDATELERLTGLAKGTRERGWWQNYPLDSPDFRELLGYEAGASYIRQFEPSIIPGLLQTPDYARIIVREFVGDLGDDQVDALVDLRIRRQDYLADRDPRPYRFFILDEAAIRRQVGATLPHGRSIMPRQLRQIAEQSEDESMTVEVIPFAKGAHYGMRGPIVLMEFDADLGEVLYLENHRGRSRILTGREEEIIEYRERFEDLRTWTASPADSRDLILKAADEMEK
ncbi:helix-turn-helix transcriptional regulator [Actinocorallia longicatena]